VKIGYEFFNLHAGAAGEASVIQVDLPALRSLKNQLEGYVQCILMATSRSSSIPSNQYLKEWPTLLRPTTLISRPNSGGSPSRRQYRQRGDRTACLYRE
jgi:hypothetical protein